MENSQYWGGGNFLVLDCNAGWV